MSRPQRVSPSGSEDGLVPLPSAGSDGGVGGGEDPAPAAYLGGNPRSTRGKWRSEVGREDLKPQSERVTKSVTTWDAGT